MDDTNIFKGPEIWGGIECTINRIGNEFKDQLAYSGHYQRTGDLEKISQLGFAAIRYPVLWEKHQPVKNQDIDWNWTDKKLEFIRLSGMRPIVGLVHHGSGPAHTNLLDPEFPHLLAAYAYEVASRYPWLEYYTPVNEPLTTARFSGLYGLWYPHHRSEHSFYKMLMNQLKGTVLAMEAIRSVNPSAKLIQTEDLGKTYSTPLLAYQADFENERRLLTFDMLAGRLKSSHPHYQYILDCGIRKEDLDFFQQHPMNPAMLGLNYYITSERWLDESVGKYHPGTHGGNARHRYADTEMVRVNNQQRAGLKKLVTEIWERYHIPLAITEVHLHCTREEQLRWFKEIWDDAVTLAKNGIPVQGVTAWAVLGSFDWDTLLTKTGTQYESGIFDVKTIPGALRQTALATLLKTISGGEQKFHPVLSASGWWHSQTQRKEDNYQRVIILEGDRKDESTNSTNKLVTAIQTACNQRRIENDVVANVNGAGWKLQKPWAIIAIKDANPELAAYCSENNIQYVTFCKEGELEYGLHIMADQRNMNLHQINKVLDLMIDGDQGYWIFDAGEITFKTNILMALKKSNPNA